MASSPNIPGTPDFLLCFSRTFLWRIALLVALCACFVYLGQVLILLFAGILLAIVLTAITEATRRRLSLSRSGSYVFVLVCTASLIILLIYLLGPRVLGQLHEIAKAIPASLNGVKGELEKQGWGRDLVHVVQASVQGHEIATHVAGYANSVVNAITDVVVIIAVALFLGGDPEFYWRGLMRLVPTKNRDSASKLMLEAAATARSWTLGQMIPMFALGIGSFIGLSILQVPLAFTLSLITAAMLFVPYVGSVIAYVPTALIAITQGPQKVLYVTILYLGIHLLEGYVISPIVQRHAVRLPPVLTLASQLVMWKIAGILGVLIATPLAAILLLMVQRLYLKEPEPAQHNEVAAPG